MRRHSAIEIQISARVSLPKNGRPLTEEIIREAIIRRARTDEEIPGIELRIVRWRHGSAKYRRGHESDWEYFRRFLPAESIIIHPIESVRSS